MPVRSGPSRRRTGSVAALFALLVSCAFEAFAAEGRPLDTNYVRRTTSGVRTPAPEAAAAELIQCLVGADVVVENVVLSGAPVATGLFAGKLDVVGFDAGMILSSGDAATLAGPNLGDFTSTVNSGAGDPDLAALVPGYLIYDAVVLEFDFTCGTAQDVAFQYTFGSEEYNEYVDSPFNDVFGFFLNGNNIAVAPANCSGAGSVVSINNVNCGNPYVGVGPSCNCFRNNDLDDGGGAIDSELDGFTQTFYATGAIGAGTNHIKLALADAGDQVLDSDVMIRCQSFSCGAAPVTGACCLPTGPCLTLTAADCAANLGIYHGDLSECGAQTCGVVPGACCFADDSCEAESADSCAQAGGDYLGDLTACVPNPCGAPLGACCTGAGSCSITDSFSCSGDWVGTGTTCAGDPCAELVGACCADVAVCELQTAADCGDTFLGIGTHCAPNPCEEILGACCHDSGFCELTLVADCGDTYMGNRTVCDPTPCGFTSGELLVDGFELGTTSSWSDTVP